MEGTPLNERPLNERNVGKAFARVVRAAGFPYHFSPHSLRHTFAPLILDDPLAQSDETRRPAPYRVLRQACLRRKHPRLPVRCTCLRVTRKQAQTGRGRQASEHVQIVFVTSHSDTAGLAPEQVVGDVLGKNLRITAVRYDIRFRKFRS